MKNSFRVQLLFINIFIAIFLIDCSKSTESNNENSKDYITYVNNQTNGSIYDGKSWETAFLTIQEGIDNADSIYSDENSKEVWVSAGTYVECITMKSVILLYGGFSGDETSLEQRDWSTNITIIDGNNENRVVSVCFILAITRIDGFTICNGNGYNSGNCSGGGIHCNPDDFSLLTIENNIIRDNIAANGGGIFLSGSSSNILHNLIIGNDVDGYCGGGIACDNCSPFISNNIISENKGSIGAGIHGYLQRGIISNNIISDNIGRGIRCNGCSAFIINNIFSNNSKESIDCYNSTIKIYNNTICKNGFNGNGVHYAAIDIYGNSSPLIVNNIVAYNESGIKNRNQTPTLRNNCVFGNNLYDYDGILPGIGDISEDPEFVNLNSDNFHIISSSPCIDAGDNNVIQSDWLDIDGQQRIYGTNVDIGADEFVP